MHRVDCFACGRKRLSKDEIALNKKMLGRDIRRFYCLACLADYLGVSVVELLAKIEEFKEQGCALFSE